jgi:hypothetical protein
VRYRDVMIAGLFSSPASLQAQASAAPHPPWLKYNITFFFYYFSNYISCLTS